MISQFIKALEYLIDVLKQDKIRKLMEFESTTKLWIVPSGA